MSRRSRVQRKMAAPDPIYNSRLVTLLVSRILKSGKKITCTKNCLSSFRNYFNKNR